MEILKKRLAYIDAMRGFTMILVVFSHIQYFGYGEFAKSAHNLIGGGNVLIYRDLIVLFFMPLFFFISGFVLYKPDAEWNGIVSLKFIAKKAVQLLVPTVVFISLYIFVYDPPLNLLWQSGRLGYWFTIALFEYYLLYALFRWICHRLHRQDGIDWLLLTGSAMLYFAVTQSVMNRLGISNETISLLGLDQLRFFFYFAIGVLVRKHFTRFIEFIENGKLVALLIIAFYALFLIVHRNGFSFGNAMVYHLYNFICGLMSLLVVFIFFYKYRNTFEDTSKMGKWLQYIGRNTLAIYMLHYFFLPRNLHFIGDFFVQHSNPTVELFITMGIAILVIVITLIANAMICTSPLLAHYLIKKKKR